jgi:hypothetical protein
MEPTPKARRKPRERDEGMDGISAGNESLLGKVFQLSYRHPKRLP